MSQHTLYNDLVITGDLTVSGTTTTISTTNLIVEDKNIILGNVDNTPTDTTADGGGITLRGATDKTFNWSLSTSSWTSSEDLNLSSGKVYEINGTNVLSSTALGSGVTASSLTSVGTIGTGTWNGTIIGPTYGGTGVNNGTKTITLGGNLTTSGAFTTTLIATGNTSVTLPTSGTLANRETNLSQFAATSSVQLAGVINDETGSGSLVFATSPTLTTPTIGTINGSTAASGTLTLRSTSSSTKATAGVLMTDNISSSSSTTGSLVVTGGVGVSGNLYAGGNVYANNEILATKNYVDTLAEGLHVHAQAHVILNTPLETITGGSVAYNNGTDGVGAYLTLSNPINFTTGLEGDTDLGVGSRIIVNGQSQALRNGIYVIASTTRLDRATDFDTPLAMAGGDFVFVTHGSTYANTGWVLGEAVTSVGVSTVNFIQFSGAGTPVAGTGLTADGLILNVGGTSGRIVANADSIDLATTGVSAGTYENVTVDAYGRITSGTNTTFDSSITGSGKTFTNADDGKIFHITGANTLTLPTYASANSRWSIGFVNVDGATLTLKITDGSGNTINDEDTIINTVKWSSVYVYKSDITNKFIAIGVLN